MNADRNADARTLDSLGWISLGFLLLYSVCVAFFYSTWLIGRTPFSAVPFDLVLNPSMTVASIAVAVLALGCRRLKALPVLAAGYALLVAAVVLLFVAATQTSDVFIAPAALCAGAGMSLTVPWFFEALAKLPGKQAAYGCGIMALGGMVLAMGAGFLPSPILLVFQLLALGASAFCLAKGAGSSQQLDSGSLTASAPTRTPAQPLRSIALGSLLVPGLCTFALSVVYGIIDMAATGTSEQLETSILISQTGGIAAAAVFLAYFRFRKSSSTTRVTNGVLGLLATGILLLPFLPATYAIALNVCAASGWKLVMLLLFYLVISTFSENRKLLIAAIALAYALPRFGLFLGMRVGDVANVGSGDFLRTIAVAFFLLYLILMVVWVANSHERKRAEGLARTADAKLEQLARMQSDLRKQRCDELAGQYGLTPREAEIMFLLSQGRDAVFIAETLFLSRNTVKSYQKNVYAKLGVHSKQEIIDLVQDDAAPSAAL